MTVDLDEEHAGYELLRMAGCDTVSQAVKNWDAERQAMWELQDINAAWKIYHRRFSLVADVIVKFLDLVDHEGAMFLSQKAKDLAAAMRKQIAEMDVALKKVRELLDM